MSNVQITTPGIKRALKGYKFYQALTEYVWNGFDAGASEISIDYVSDPLEAITSISVSDNGSGIQKSDLPKKFTPFFESNKLYNPDTKESDALVHLARGKNGVGRLTFFHFASKATWNTVYSNGDKHYRYDIIVTDDRLENYDADRPEVETSEKLGTIVVFSGNIRVSKYQMDDDFLSYLKREFAWFLELNSGNKRIVVNEVPLDYFDLIGEKASFSNINPDTQTKFTSIFLRWAEKLNSEYSRYYFLDSSGRLRFKKTTTLNKKGDSFFHSVYISSKLFDDVKTEPNIPTPSSLFQDKAAEDYKFIVGQVNDFLHNKRKPFLAAYTDKLISDFEENKAFPDYNAGNEWEKLKRDELTEVVRQLYVVEPRIFVKLNLEQKRTFIRLINLVLDAGEVDSLFKILTEVVDLDQEERNQLAEIFKETRLTRVVKTMKFLMDRYNAVEDLKKLVFDESINANEVLHLQTFIEAHYWLFGEEYALLTAAEPDFEEALRRYTYILSGNKKKRKIHHSSKNREMDIFAVRRDLRNNVIHNIVVELKHPMKALGKTELDQVKDYMDVIIKQPEFNASNMKWVFFLVGKKFDESGYIEREIKNAENHGESSLVFKGGNYKIFVKKWSEVIAEFELRHKFLTEKLAFERRSAEKDSITAKKILERAKKSTAQAPAEISAPK